MHGHAGVVQFSFTAASTGSFAIYVQLYGRNVTAFKSSAGAPLNVAVSASLTADVTQTVAWGSMLAGVLSELL